MLTTIGQASIAKENKLDRAIQDYDQIIRLNPNFRWAYGNRGEVFNMLGEYDKAIQDFDRANRDPTIHCCL